VILKKQPNQSREIAAQQRLSASQSDFVDAEIRKVAGQLGHFLEGEHVLPRQPHIFFLRHTIRASQVAPVGHGQAQTSQRPTKGVNNGLI
jgi:hypothetical protein